MRRSILNSLLRPSANGISRRLFLKSTAWISLLALGGRGLVNAQSARGERVLVIGAGIAGLAAARDLVARGYEVQIIEGRNRTGGRIYTNRDLPGGTPIDLGASWIHGWKGNPITDLARKAGATLADTNYSSGITYDTDGAVRTGAQDTALNTEYDTMMANLPTTSDSTVTMKSGMENAKGIAFDSFSPQLKWKIAEYENGVSDNVEYQALRFNHSNSPDDRFGADDRLFPGGYEQIINYLRTNLNIALSRRVTAITVSGSTVTVNADGGAAFTGDRCIITLPLGVLKFGSVTFNPALSQAKLDAISRHGFATLDKFGIKFDSAFWETQWGGPNYEFIGNISATRGRFPTFVNLNNTAYGPGSNALMGLFSGDFARLTAEPLSNNALRDEVMVDILRMFPAATAPTGFVRHSWFEDEFARGAYTFIRAVTGAGGANLDTIAAPIGDRLFFAGEHTSRKYPNTVHGAYLSGLRAAAEIAAM